MAAEAVKLELTVRDATTLRALLQQTASPGSWQQDIIRRLDSALVRTVTLA